MGNQNETPKPIMATDVMKRIEALELGYRDAKATNAEIQDDVDRIDGAVAELLEWCKRLSREQTAEPATKAETQPPDTASEDEIMGREFDLLRPGDVIENALGERFAVMEIANGSSVRKGTIRMRHVLHTGGYPSSECRRERYVKDHWRRVVQSKHEEPTEPPLQWVDWREGMVIEEGLYPVVVGADTWVSTRTFRGGEWRWSDGMPCGPYISRYLPIRLPDPFAKQ